MGVKLLLLYIPPSQNERVDGERKGCGRGNKVTGGLILFQSCLCTSWNKSKSSNKQRSFTLPSIFPPHPELCTAQVLHMQTSPWRRILLWVIPESRLWSRTAGETVLVLIHLSENIYFHLQTSQQESWMEDNDRKQDQKTTSSPGERWFRV